MHLSWNTGGYIFSAMRCQVLKTVPKCSSRRALQDDSFSILMLMGFFWLTSSCANCQTPMIRIKCKNLLQKNLNRQLYWNPHWEKVRISFQPYLFSHIFSAISFQPYGATCWKLFQSVPLYEVYEMTAFDFDVNGFSSFEILQNLLFRISVLPPVLSVKKCEFI